MLTDVPENDMIKTKRRFHYHWHIVQFNLVLTALEEAFVHIHLNHLLMYRKEASVCTIHCPHLHKTRLQNDRQLLGLHLSSFLWVLCQQPRHVCWTNLNKKTTTKVKGLLVLEQLNWCGDFQWAAMETKLCRLMPRIPSKHIELQWIQVQRPAKEQIKLCLV